MSNRIYKNVPPLLQDNGKANHFISDRLAFKNYKIERKLLVRFVISNFYF